jgi:hypothetical protein
MTLLQNWLAEVESWVGTPYVTEGCTKGLKGGTDCGHWLVKAILASIPNSEHALAILDVSHTQFFKKNISLVQELMDPLSTPIKFEDIQVGDILFLRFRRISSQPAVYVGDDHYVYCDTSMKQIVKRGLSGNDIDRISEVFRFNSMVEES